MSLYRDVIFIIFDYLAAAARIEVDDYFSDNYPQGKKVDFKGRNLNYEISFRGRRYETYIGEFIDDIFDGMTRFYFEKFKKINLALGLPLVCKDYYEFFKEYQKRPDYTKDSFRYLKLNILNVKEFGNITGIIMYDMPFDIGFLTKKSIFKNTFLRHFFIFENTFPTVFYLNKSFDIIWIQRVSEEIKLRIERMRHEYPFGKKISINVDNDNLYTIKYMDDRLSFFNGNITKINHSRRSLYQLIDDINGEFQKLYSFSYNYQKTLFYKYLFLNDIEMYKFFNEIDFIFINNFTNINKFKTQSNENELLFYKIN